MSEEGAEKEQESAHGRAIGTPRKVEENQDDENDENDDDGGGEDNEEVEDKTPHE